MWNCARFRKAVNCSNSDEQCWLEVASGKKVEVLPLQAMRRAKDSAGKLEQIELAKSDKNEKEDEHLLQDS